MLSIYRWLTEVKVSAKEYLIAFGIHSSLLLSIAINALWMHEISLVDSLSSPFELLFFQPHNDNDRKFLVIIQFFKKAVDQKPGSKILMENSCNDH
jgi:hypothetical protein